MPYSSPLEGRGKVRVITITLKLISGIFKGNPSPRISLGKRISITEFQ
jgi:hypothetical protein